MNKQITKCAVVIATAGALALGAVTPSWASPVSSSSAVVKESAPSAVSDVRYRGNSGRYYRNNDAGVALSACGPTTIEVARADEALRGQVPSEDLFVKAGEIASADCFPLSDGRGPADYKRHLAGVLTQRALRRATARALHQEA